MKSIVLLYDEREVAVVEAEILPALRENLKLKLPFNNDLTVQLGNEDFVVTFLGDDQLRELIPLAIKENWMVGLLPHPRMAQAKAGLGVEGRLSATLEDMLEAEEARPIDVLLANGRPVFNTLVIGESLSLMSGAVKDGFWARSVSKLSAFFRLFRRLESSLFTLEFPEKSPINTACLGMVVVQHGQSSRLSRMVLEDAFINDGRMHLIALAPRSVTGLIWFGFYSIFRSSSRRLPPFAAHIKTDKIHIKSDDAINFTCDGVLMSAREIDLEVVSQAIRLIPGRYLKMEAKPVKQDVFKVEVLPRGESRDALVNRPLPFIHHASKEEFKELFSTLRLNAQASGSYLVLMILSTCIATLGLFGNSSPVIIGAMILAPLMSPIISMSMGVLRQDRQLMWDSSAAIGLGLILAYLCAVFITWLTPLSIPNDEILARVRPNLLDLGVAVASGVAGAYAHAKEEVAKTLAGVAIAVALVPPLAVSGIGLGWADWGIFSGALLLLMTNLAGILLAAAFTFLLLGFSPFRLATKGLVYSLLVVVLISLPLFFGFIDMVREKDVISKLNGHRIEEAVLRDIRVRQVKPLRLAVKIVSDYSLSSEQIQEVKKEIEALVGEEVELEVTFGLKVL
ncbi:MAG: DUF389 domain-containing protein [Lunatimonas sp.]|uniref:DUF389 domain-containing protein n=1 Tax=Lunatimonas sp. TaxID=2060141 RepID=UPI00263A4997|nr:DUF389 domain-containing protein [Lunatimonas sp.]MCC5938559.1 DUF389 domain-containing protein [Lunatimonas sp.]